MQINEYSAFCSVCPEHLASRGTWHWWAPITKPNTSVHSAGWACGQIIQEWQQANAWNFAGIDLMPFPLPLNLTQSIRKREGKSPLKTGGESGGTEIGYVRYKRKKKDLIWGKACQKPLEHALEVRIQLWCKGIYSSQWSERALARHIPYLKPPFNPFYCYHSHFYADCPQGIIHIWIFKYFSSILSRQRLHDVSYTEVKRYSYVNQSRLSMHCVTFYIPLFLPLKVVAWEWLYWGWVELGNLIMEYFSGLLHILQYERIQGSEPDAWRVILSTHNLPHT